MTTQEKEQMVIAAIKGGADTRAAIIKATGLSHGWIGNRLRLLLAEHGCKNLYELVCILVPPVAPETRSKFTSHDCAIVDKAMRPDLAASMLVQVLGKNYCLELIKALRVESLMGIW